ncbi:hypothetical protein R3P38DRAFT_2770925 [Favolaschia claudopus]|uniref:Uncharacterized protein n=1 Tax=Favolaschia claudopus TaxID=2862362 RepID=A0AAW0CDB5_9AGAR
MDFVPEFGFCTGCLYPYLQLCSDKITRLDNIHSSYNISRLKNSSANKINLQKGRVQISTKIHSYRGCSRNTHLFVQKKRTQPHVLQKPTQAVVGVQDRASQSADGSHGSKKNPPASQIRSPNTLSAPSEHYQAIHLRRIITAKIEDTSQICSGHHFGKSQYIGNVTKLELVVQQKSDKKCTARESKKKKHTLVTPQIAQLYALWQSFTAATKCTKTTTGEHFAIQQD